MNWIPIGLNWTILFKCLEMTIVVIWRYINKTELNWIELRFQDHIRIAEAARKMGNVTWEEHRIRVFADYSKLLSERRAKFNECKKLLHDKHIHFPLNYPAVLNMVLNPQGLRRFEDHKKASTFCAHSKSFWSSFASARRAVLCLYFEDPFTHL